jgi:AraC family transcriptional activator of pobA
MAHQGAAHRLPVAGSEDDVSANASHRQQRNAHPITSNSRGANCVRPTATDAIKIERMAIVTRHVCDHVPCRTPVTHSYAALAFYTSGCSRVELNGRWNLRPGDVLLVPAGEPHRIISTQQPEYWGVGFSVPCLAENSGTTLLQPFERVREGAAAVVHIPPSRHEFLERLFVELQDVSAVARIGSNTLHAVQRSLITLILVEVDRAFSANGVRRASGGGVVVDALRYIERNCLGRLKVQDVAKAVGRSPTYVTAALTQATGRSAGSWIVSGRMAEARRLLLHSDEMVDVVAERVGYADATHFIRMFRREHGTTPAAWRTTQAVGRFT